jgi:hypothetical protein
VRFSDKYSIGYEAEKRNNQEGERFRDDPADRLYRLSVKESLQRGQGRCEEDVTGRRLFSAPDL